ncbi:hypothetical protein HNQ50_001180 [Silvimonas terrae]|uniref:Uncharacterized protein n=1 Tax=Silvimonas terrae TaxID=300266 RepID=A0A840RD41_9NEIS|nr:nucleic acid/nucleotide deaminase domain-containing protein [Silvimonas terrae]MBB5190458.1 hypothetical protein [Silvimonas terrae]
MPKGNYTYVPKQGLDSGADHKENANALVFHLESGDKIMTQVHYENMDFRNLNYLDKIARSILSICHSADSPDFVRQNLVDMNTVAVYPYGPVLVVACSGKVTLNRNLILSCLGDTIADYGFSSILIIGGGGPQQQHAEMQIADFHLVHPPETGWGIIGVSKPCCILCAEKLDDLNINYSYWHDQNVGSIAKRKAHGGFSAGWIPPLYTK